MSKKNKTTGIETLSPVVRGHITALGLTSVEAYRGWCHDHGCSRSLDKSWRQRCREREIAAAPAIEQCLRRRRRESRNFGETAQLVCSGELRASEVRSPVLQQLSRYTSPKRAVFDGRPLPRECLARLLSHLDKQRVKFLDPSAPVWDTGTNTIDALVAIATYSGQWVRPLDRWKPRTRSANRQLASLLRHLFARYDVPSFLDAAWFAGAGREARKQRGWYLHVGQGLNIRHCETPIPLSKKMAHVFMQAPSTVPVLEAFRWAQVRTLGGDERLARAICATRLGTQFAHNEFWATVVAWFIAHPMLDRVHVGPIVDFLHTQKFEPDESVTPVGPLQPNLTMRGRSPHALLRLVETWHRRLANDNRIQVREWKPQPFDGFELTEGDRAGRNWRHWTIRELVSTKALVAEGRAMRHCVASYARSCSLGASSIWTMEVQRDDGYAKAVTIEIRNQQRLICQIRGRSNRAVTEQELGLLRRWAAKVGLKIAAYA